MLVEYRYKADKTDFPHFLQTGALTESEAYAEFWRVMEDIFDEADDVYIVGITIEDQAMSLHECQEMFRLARRCHKHTVSNLTSILS